MKLIQIKEAGERLGVSRQTITNWSKQGVFRLRKIGKALWVDEETIVRMADTAQDIERTRALLKKEQEELRMAYDEEHSILTDVRKEVMLVARYRNNLVAREFYLSIPRALQSLGIICQREADVMCSVIHGHDIGWIAEDYGITREGVAQIFFRGCSKARKLQGLKDRIERAEEILSDNEALRRKNELLTRILKDIEKENGTSLLPKDKEEEDLLTKDIRRCDLSIRAKNVLHAIGINTIGELVQVRKSQLRSIRNCGEKTIDELDSFIRSKGLKWGLKYINYDMKNGYVISDESAY